ncbi:hypothetical protein OOK60_12920 [Trichothermofontia sichuanensis B231]|uniref:hypothetical protein n=1 Tax=Trichothermofontia sichuanensis TaxID=3045816 RepID=UPI0022465952|nr:hypothetical protein [Trichothermofontia sichuanensis]UZQ53401.1 hypothetical protein OOK60_12920 [Trichothermofontia sichuanensis B231]
MPIIVSNTSPLLNLAIIDHLFLLPQQFGKIYIPNAVFCELRINENLPGSNSLKIAYEQGWLKVKPIDNTWKPARLPEALT